MTKQIILLIDTDNLSHIAFYATYRGEAAPVMSCGGFPTNAIATWSSMLATLISQVNPTRVIFGLEGGSDFRRSLLPNYKASRTAKPEALQKQLPEITEIVRNSGVQYLYTRGEEADDVIMSFANRSRGLDGVEILIASRDKDFGQVVGDNVFQLRPAGSGVWDRFDAPRLTETMGVTPSQVALYLALTGDDVDDIPGIEGVGPVTATKLLAGNPSLTELAARLAEKKKWTQEAAMEQVSFNLRLTTFRDLPDSMPTRGASPESVLDRLDQLECRQARKIWLRMVERFGPESKAAAKPETPRAPVEIPPAPKAERVAQTELVF